MRIRGRRMLASDALVLLALTLCTVAVAWLAILTPSWVSVSMLALVLLAGGFMLSLRSQLVLTVAVAAAVALVLYRRSANGQQISPGPVLVVGIVAVMVALLARSRGRLGVQGTRGESMLVDLRDRLRAQGELPELPEEWEAEVVLRSAGGASFSGDFLVATRSADGRILEVSLVDVSGKGVDAGTRALLLSGAFGGLLGSLPPEEFLPAANAYLIRQSWDEGFATAAHLVLDLDTGEYVVATAGHPPAAHFSAGNGRWRVHEHAEGPLLGLVPDAKYVSEAGRLERGDAMLLYTDGLIETPGLDLSVGIDKLLGEAERLVTRGFRHGARKLIDAVAATTYDDRALVLIWRA